jgi:SAM-dependent methyltransferase
VAEEFDGDWLDLREPYDAAARDPGLAAMLAAALPARPRLLDLGAGTGSLLRWLGHFIGRAQAWTLVDRDAALIERAFETIAERAEAVGWAATWPGKRTLLLHSPEGAWRVEGLIANLVLAPANLPLDRVDAVVNTALCDLVSRDWVEAIAAACARPFSLACAFVRPSCETGRRGKKGISPRAGPTRSKEARWGRWPSGCHVS